MSPCEGQTAHLEIKRHGVNGVSGTEDGILKVNDDRAKELFYVSFKAK